MKRFRDRKHDQAGFSLIDIVIGIALFLAVGGSFVYATISIEAARKHSLEETKSTISQTGVVNSFRADVGKARAVQVNDLKNSLSIAKSDGSCARWTLQPVEGSTTELKLVRAVDPAKAPAAGSGSALAESISAGTLSYSGESATLNLIFKSGTKMNESMKLNLAGSDGGMCW